MQDDRVLQTYTSYIWCNKVVSLYTRHLTTMNALSGFIRDSQPKTQSADHAIPTLCDRLTHATLLEDRRSAVLALKGLSKEYREAVAAGGMRGLISALTKDNDDDETVRASLETLLILFLGNESDDRSTRGSLTRRGLKYISPLLRDTSSIDFIALWLTDEFSQVSMRGGNSTRGLQRIHEDHLVHPHQPDQHSSSPMANTEQRELCDSDRPTIEPRHIHSTLHAETSGSSGPEPV